MELTEVILLFFNKSILIIAIILLIIAFSYYMDEKINQNKEVFKQPEKISKIKRLKKHLELVLILCPIFLIAIALISKDYIKLFFPICFIICFIIYFIFEKTIFKKLLVNHSRYLSFSIVFSFGVLLLFNLYTLTFIVENGYSVRYENMAIRQVSFSYNNQIIKTSNTIVYVGETKSNLFLFDRKTEQTIIFKMEEIDELKFKLK